MGNDDEGTQNRKLVMCHLAYREKEAKTFYLKDNEKFVCFIDKPMNKHTSYISVLLRVEPQ